MQKYSTPSATLNNGSTYSCTIPASHRPARNVYGVAPIMIQGSSSSFGASMLYRIYSTGAFEFMPLSAGTSFGSIGTGNNFAFNIKYPLY